MRESVQEGKGGACLNANPESAVLRATGTKEQVSDQSSVSKCKPTDLHRVFCLRRGAGQTMRGLPCPCTGRNGAGSIRGMRRVKKKNKQGRGIAAPAIMARSFHSSSSSPEPPPPARPDPRGTPSDQWDGRQWITVWTKTKETN